MIEAVIPQFVAALCLLEVTLSLPHEYGYEPECRTVCDTIYKTIYEKSYKNECSTNYVSSCPTSYRTEYRRECSTIYKKSAQEGAVGKFHFCSLFDSNLEGIWSKVSLNYLPTITQWTNPSEILTQGWDKSV